MLKGYKVGNGLKTCLVITPHISSAPDYLLLVPLFSPMPCASPLPKPFLISALPLAQVEVVPEALYWYRTNSGSMIRNKIYAVTKSLPLRSFLAHGSPSISPAIAVAAQQAEDVSLLRTKVGARDDKGSPELCCF